jgi:hypothetical protein
MATTVRIPSAEIRETVNIDWNAGALIYRNGQGRAESGLTEIKDGGADQSSTSKDDDWEWRTSMTDPVKPVATWRKVLAAILDFFTVFFAGGYAIAQLTGNVTAEGFKLEGIPALILFALIVVYFVIGGKYLGGTIWQRILYTP